MLTVEICRVCSYCHAGVPAITRLCPLARAEARVAELEAKLESQACAHADVVAALEARLCRLSGGN